MKKRMLPWLLSFAVVLSVFTFGLATSAWASPVFPGGYGWSAYHPTGGFTGPVEVPSDSDIVPIGTAVDASLYMTGMDFVGETLYGVSNDANSRLYTIDPDTGAYTLIANTNESLMAFCYDISTDTAYVSAQEEYSHGLHSINLATGETTPIGLFGGGIVIGLASDSDGNIYGIDMTNDTLLSINKTTGAGTVIGSLGIDITYSQDIAYDRANGILYGTLYIGGGGGLYSINTSTGAATLIRSLSAEISAFAIPYAQNVAEVDGTGYSTLSDALTNVQGGQTIKLLQDVTYNSMILVSGKTFTIDVNDYTLTVDATDQNCIYAQDGYSLYIVDNGASEINGGFIANTSGSYSGIEAYGAGQILVEAPAALTVTGSDTQNQGIYTCGGREVYFNGDITVTGNPNYGVYAESGLYGSLITINGEIHSDNMIRINESVFQDLDDCITPTTKSGYLTFVDSEDTATDPRSTVWLKEIVDTDCIVPDCSATIEEGGFTEFTDIGDKRYYHVSTPAQLAHINNHRDLNFIQTADIDLSEVTWTPIGWVSNYYGQNLSFNGHYNGQGYSISNLKISSGISWAGLFAAVGSTGVLEDIVLENVDITAGYHSGALVGENRGYISGCTVTGTINGAGQFGGLVGMSHNALLEDCYSSATVTGTGESVGGLVGYSTNNSGSANDSIVRCSFTGNVSGNQRTGGLVGTLQGGLLSESFAAGNVSGLNTYTGGLVGVIESANGFVAAVENSYARSSVMASGSQYVGGLAGANWWGTIHNSYSAGTINLDGVTDSGGLTGTIYTGAVAVDSYYDSELCLLSDTGKGIPKTTEEMKDLATYSTWSFPNVWTLSSDNNGYPALAWQGFTHDTISNDAELSSLSATNATLSPDFQSAVTSYTAIVANNVGSTIVAASANDSGAIIEINGSVATSQLVVLNVGSNIINVEVTAEDEVTTNAYTITINRAAASGFSGGGGESTSPTIVVTTETNNGSTSNSITVDPNVSSYIANVSITKAMTNALLEKAQDTYGDGKGDLIEVRVDTPASTEQLTFNISQSELAKIADETSADFGISSPFISIVFDGKAIDIISEVDSDGKVLITATKIANMNGRPVYDLTVMNGKTQVSDFKGGHATVTIPYELKLGENPNAVVIYYLADDGTFKAVRGHYDVSLKAVVFKTTHFSKFVIGYNPVSFNDVASDAWYKNAVDFIAARGITSGTGDNMYSPEEKLTRAQFVVLMMNAYQINTQNQGVSNQIQNFSDAGNAYYTDYLLTAKALSIVNGVGSNMFAPEQVISRQEMFVILYNALDVIEELPQASSDKQLIDFGDVNQMASWAQEAMSALIEGGVISGSNGMLNPKVSTTRAEIAQMLYNLLSK